MKITDKETTMLLLLGLGLLFLRNREVGDVDMNGTANETSDKALLLLVGAAVAFYVL